MTHTPEDEWFGPDDPGPSAERPRQPADDDWLAGSATRRRPAPFDWAALASPQAMAGIGAAMIAVVALAAVVIAFTDSSPSGAQTVPLASVPVSTPALSRTTTPAASASQSVTAPTTTLKPGDTGAQVKTLQRELKALGYAIGAIDGSYGSQTSKAVSAFQTAHHLTADGIVGPQTLQALAP